MSHERLCILNLLRDIPIHLVTCFPKRRTHAVISKLRVQTQPTMDIFGNSANRVLRALHRVQVDVLHTFSPAVFLNIEHVLHEFLGLRGSSAARSGATRPSGHLCLRR